MKPSELLALLQRLGVQPSRKLGQNFLVDDNLLGAIVRAAQPPDGGLVVEVGPGTGMLTRALLAAGSEVIAVELDRRLAAWLRETFAAEPRLHLVEADACRVDYDELTRGRPYVCIANLPYAVSTVVLAKLLAAANRPQRLCVLLQLEMAERLAAAPGSKAYGALTVRVQAVYQVALVRRIPPTVFLPQPEVASALVALTPCAGPAWPAADWAGFSALVQAAFSQRRKMLGKVLRGHYDADRVAIALAAAGLTPDIRPERVTVAQFGTLYRALQP
jgi:16S rRNA (adenine1518-N6/adenine1519-N6)-dimethyltransferase